MSKAQPPHPADSIHQPKKSSHADTPPHPSFQKVWFCPAKGMVSYHKRYGFARSYHTFCSPIDMAWQKTANKLQNDRKHPIAQTLKKPYTKRRKTPMAKTIDRGKTTNRQHCKKRLSSPRTPKAEAQRLRLGFFYIS